MGWSEVCTCTAVGVLFAASAILTGLGVFAPAVLYGDHLPSINVTRIREGNETGVLVSWNNLRAKQVEKGRFYLYGTYRSNPCVSFSTPLWFYLIEISDLEPNSYVIPKNDGYGDVGDDVGITSRYAGSVLLANTMELWQEDLETMHYALCFMMPFQVQGAGHGGTHKLYDEKKWGQLVCYKHLDTRKKKGTPQLRYTDMRSPICHFDNGGWVTLTAVLAIIGLLTLRAAYRVYMEMRENWVKCRRVAPLENKDKDTLEEVQCF